MPDTRTERGPHPKDLRSFEAEDLPRLRSAVGDLCWLLSRGYPRRAALELVGNRYQLRDRQRRAVHLCAASDEECRRRQEHRIEPGEVAGRALLVDGYNVLLTVEAALSGGILLRACDGTFRDLASMRSRYHRVDSTVPALEHVARFLERHRCAHTTWCFDRPISNSGRLKVLVESLAEERGWPWEVRLHPNPDRTLARADELVATADSAILDRCSRWLNLARLVVEDSISDAWIVDLTPER